MLPDNFRCWLSLALMRATMRPADQIIGKRVDPYMLRWYLIPRNSFFSAYKHMFYRSDDDRALHSHPWLFNLSILLIGQYTEHTEAGAVVRRAGDVKFRWGAAFHRIELTHGPCMTLFITGPRVRTWGFRCPKGFVPWFTFTGDKPGSSPGVSEIGPGCGEFA